jgi:hypothetical protein
MRTTIISFDPEGRLFGYVGEFEKSYDADWLYCEAFEAFLNHMMKISGGYLILPQSQLQSVESCLGAEQTAWRILVLASDLESQNRLQGERRHYLVATRATLTATVDQMLKPLNTDAATSLETTDGDAEFEGGTLAEAGDFDDRGEAPSVPIFSMDELADFEAEMDQAFTAVGEIDPESAVDLSVFGSEKASSSEREPVDPATMTMELAVSDLEDLEDISGIFDDEEHLDASVVSSMPEALTDAQDSEHALLVETQAIDPDVLLDSEQPSSPQHRAVEDPSMLTSTPLEATQIIAPEVIESALFEGTQVIDEEMIESELVDGTQVIDDEMIEEALIDGTQAVDEAMIESASHLTQDVSPDEVEAIAEEDSIVSSAPPMPADDDLLKGFLDDIGDDLAELAEQNTDDDPSASEAVDPPTEPETSNASLDEMTLGQPGSEFEVVIDEAPLEVEVDEAQVLEVNTNEETANPRHIMAVDAEMVLETISEHSAQPAPVAPPVVSTAQKEELVTVRKRLLELQLDLKLSKEQVESLRTEVEGRRSTETKLRDDLRTSESRRRDTDTSVESLQERLAKQDATLNTTSQEVSRLTELTETQGSNLSESRNRQDMLESAREAAEYELETVSKRYDETKSRLEKTREELSELEQEFKRTKKKYKKDSERQSQATADVGAGHKLDVRKLKEQLQSLEKVLSTREDQLNALTESKDALEQKLAETVASEEARFTTLQTDSASQEESLSQALRTANETLKKLEIDYKDSLASGSKSHAELVDAHTTQVDTLTGEHQNTVQKLITAHETALKSALEGQELSATQAQDQAKTELQSLKLASEEQLSATKADYQSKLDALESQLLASRQKGDVQLTTVRTELGDRHKQDLEQSEFEHAESMERQATALRKEYDQLLESRLSEHGGALADLREKYQTDTAELRTSYEEKMASTMGSNESTLDRVKAEHREELLTQETEQKTQMEALQKATTERIDELRTSHKEASGQSESQHEAAIQTVRDEHAATLESLKTEQRAQTDALVEKSSVSLEALRAELEGRQIELESTLKSTSETRLQEHKDEALRQRTDFEAQIGLLKQGNEELKAEVERARLAAHERVRQEALAENAAQVAALETRFADAEEKHQVAEAAWASKQAALEEEFRVKASQSEKENQALQAAQEAAQERTAAVTEELD